MTPNDAFANSAQGKPIREPIIDAQLDADLAGLGDAVSPELTARRFELYVEATKRAVANRDLMPDLPDVIYRDYTAEIKKSTGPGVSIPKEVDAAAGRRVITRLARDGRMQAAAILGWMYIFK